MALRRHGGGEDEIFAEALGYDHDRTTKKKGRMSLARVTMFLRHDTTLRVLLIALLCLALVDIFVRLKEGGGNSHVQSHGPEDLQQVQTRKPPTSMNENEFDYIVRPKRTSPVHTGRSAPPRDVTDEKLEENRRNTLYNPTLLVPDKDDPRHKPSHLCLLVLEWNAPKSLKNSLDSWRRGRLLHFADETIIFIQEITEEKRKMAESYGLRVIGDKANINISPAFDLLVRNATCKFVMIMEKDFELVEPTHVMIEQLEAGINMIEQGDADVIRYRHRWDSGEPNYAQETYGGREDDIYYHQPNLLCNVHYWIRDPAWRWPDKFWRCRDHPEFFCSTSRYCNWTNNPSLFTKKWWMEHFSKWATAPIPPGSNFEHQLNFFWPDAWNNANHIVAFGDGLFKHHEIDR